MAGLAAPFTFQGDLKLASSQIHAGYGDLKQGGIDLFVPGAGCRWGVRLRRHSIVGRKRLRVVV